MTDTVKRTRVADLDFVTAIIKNPTLQAAGEALAEKAGGKALTPDSVYQRVQSMKKRGITIPHRPKVETKKVTADEANALIAQLTADLEGSKAAE